MQQMIITDISFLQTNANFLQDTYSVLANYIQSCINHQSYYLDCISIFIAYTYSLNIRNVNYRFSVSAVNIGIQPVK